MFSGIVTGVAKVTKLDKKAGLHSVGVKIPNSSSFKTGASVSINGVCLTVTYIEDGSICFDIMQETLKLTNLVSLKINDLVNYEPSIKLGDEIGGHLLSGHVHSRAEIIKINKTNNNCQWLLKTDSNLIDYIFPKGFIALDGASLTVGEVHLDSFNVHLIPETLRATRFKNLEVGASLNLEVDSQTQVVVDTLKKLKLKQIL